MLRLLNDTSWMYIGETCSMSLCGNESYYMYMEPEPSIYTAAALVNYDSFHTSLQIQLSLLPNNAQVIITSHAVDATIYFYLIAIYSRRKTYGN